MWRHFSFGKYALCAHLPWFHILVGGGGGNRLQRQCQSLWRGGRSFGMWALIFLELKEEVIDNF